MTRFYVLINRNHGIAITTSEHKNPRGAQSRISENIKIRGIRFRRKRRLFWCIKPTRTMLLSW